MSDITAEQRLAEMAMDDRWSVDLSDGDPREWPPVASRIREARLRTGMSDTEVARRVGLTVGSYCDLERYDSEAFEALSLQELSSLGRVLGAKPGVLLFGSAAEGLTQVITHDEITARLTEKMIESHQSAEQLGDAIGWDIKELLADPKTLWKFNIEELYDICKVIEVDWVTVLPESALAVQ